MHPFLPFNVRPTGFRRDFFPVSPLPLILPTTEVPTARRRRRSLGSMRFPHDRGSGRRPAPPLPPSPLRATGRELLLWLLLLLPAVAPLSSRVHAAPMPSSIPAVPGEPPAGFTAARPVWPAGRERERNLTVGFQAAFPTPAHGRAVLRLTASTLYRVHVNGRFAGHGPARAGHGFARVDEVDLTPLLLPNAGTNAVAIEVAGYNVNSYDLLDQPSFLQAEVVAADSVLASTSPSSAGVGAFRARGIGERVQAVQRYSFQRPFSEVWRLAPGWEAWRTQVGGNPSAAPLPLALQPGLSLLPRRVPYPTFAVRGPVRVAGGGVMQRIPPPAKPWTDRSLTGIGPLLGGFPRSELSVVPSLDLQGWRSEPAKPKGEGRSGTDPTGSGDTPSFRLADGAYRILDFGVNLSGFLGIELQASSTARVMLAFDEILREGDVDWKRLGCVNLVQLDLQPGVCRFETFEPYTLRYAKVVVLEGAADIQAVTLRELVHPDVDRARFSSSDPRLNRLFEAGRETFRQNAVDLFMDCPSRERAGWLCDSFFTARVAPHLTGDTRIERNFLENFLGPAGFEHLPEGMLPMCYPADHPDGVFIPNWALWFLLELEEYRGRSGDAALVEALRPRVLRLLEFFTRLENEHGLLEKLPGWVFVEWSKANEWVQDVNFPSNMLYARALDATANLYDLPVLREKATRLRETLRAMAFDGRFFVDNAVRKDGKLQVTTHHSEVAQYFAFQFGIATPESHPALWKTLREDFGPRRKTTGAHPEVAPANAFIGNVLRLELLAHEGLCQQTLDESVEYLLYMAERTGTLWENDGDYASCNHGFASHIVHVLYRDVLGLHAVDPVRKSLRLRFTDVRLGFCEGSLPVPDGRVALRWWQDGDIHRYQVQTPAGWKVEVEDATAGRWQRAF